MLNHMTVTNTMVLRTCKMMDRTGVQLETSTTSHRVLTKTDRTALKTASPTNGGMGSSHAEERN